MSLTRQEIRRHIHTYSYWLLKSLMIHRMGEQSRRMRRLVVQADSGPASASHTKHRNILDILTLIYVGLLYLIELVYSRLVNECRYIWNNTVHSLQLFALILFLTVIMHLTVVNTSEVNTRELCRLIASYLLLIHT